MDRLIAFLAGAVLAFALGYLVSYQINVAETESDVERARLELEQTGDDGAGLVDAAPPKLKSLPDLANQSADTLTTDLSSAEIKDLKVMLLPYLTPTDLEAWKGAREAHVAKLIRNGQTVWAVGSDEAPTKRFDLAVASDAEGRYEGQITFPENGESKAATFDLIVEMHDYKTKTPAASLAVHGKDGEPLWGQQFRWRHVGTNKDQRLVYFILPAFNPDASARSTHLAFAIPAGVETGKVVSGELMGLTPDLVWYRIGSVELLKAK